jgi:hypothetical protein
VLQSPAVATGSHTGVDGAVGATTHSLFTAQVVPAHTDEPGLAPHDSNDGTKLGGWFTGPV